MIKVILGVLVACVLLVGLVLGAAALVGGDDEPKQAPWAAPGAPDIKPGTLDPQ